MVSRLHTAVIAVVWAVVLGAFSTPTSAAGSVQHTVDAVDAIDTVGRGVEPADARVAGGRPVPLFKYPWVAQIKLPGSKMCAGALVSCQTVVTAAHCVEPYSTSELMRSARVILGNSKKDAGQSFGVADVIVHPDYSSEGFDSSSGESVHDDIAAIKLDSPTNIRPIPLARRDPRVGTRGYVLGWGETESASSSEMLRRAMLHVHGREACETDVGGKDYFDPESSVCTGSGAPPKPSDVGGGGGSSGGPSWPNNTPKPRPKPSRPPKRPRSPRPSKGGRNHLKKPSPSGASTSARAAASACKGDSGGPFIDRSGRQLWGVVSFGFSEDGSSSCGSEGRQTVITSVAAFRSAILSVIEDWGEQCRRTETSDLTTYESLGDYENNTKKKKKKKRRRRGEKGGQ